MTHPFDVACALVPDGAGRFRVTVAPDWHQGRGAYGGLVAAQCARAIEAVVDDDRRRLRTLHVHFAAPVPEGESEIVVERVRDGAFVTHLRATMRHRGDVVAMASATCAAARGHAITYDHDPAPVVPPPDDVDPIELGPPIAPVFTQHFEYRFAQGGVPYSGHAVPELVGYIAARPPRPVDVALAIAYLDAWPPSVLVTVAGFRGAATVDFRVEILPAFFTAAAGVSAPLLVDIRSRIADDGYADEEVRLCAGGVVVARCQQLYAVFEPPAA